MGSETVGSAKVKWAVRPSLHTYIHVTGPSPSPAPHRSLGLGLLGMVRTRSRSTTHVHARQAARCARLRVPVGVPNDAHMITADGSHTCVTNGSCANTRQAIALRAHARTHARTRTAQLPCRKNRLGLFISSVVVKPSETLTDRATECTVHCPLTG